MPRGMGFKRNLAATYSPADKPQYHRREGVLLPCSGWERVWPPCHGHQGTGSNMIRPVRSGRERQYGQASRSISNGRLNALPRLYRRPINQVVCLAPSVPSRGRGWLISGRASRLDAFSGYPVRTWLPSRAAGATAGTPEVRPLRSSRTKSRTPQPSIDCSR